MGRVWLFAASLCFLVIGTAYGGEYLPLPPILQGYHGPAPYKSKSGGLVDPTLRNYIDGKPFVNSRGTWYDIVTWAARTHHCDNFPKSVSCMACAMDMPPFTGPAGVVPIAVGSEFFGTPEKGATCGMCVRVFMPQNYKYCADHDSNPYCSGVGSRPYIKYMSASWAWRAKIGWSPAEKLHYYDAIIIEWFDRAAKVPYQITMPTQGKNTANFGDWPIKYKAIPCPTGNLTMRFQFLDFRKPVPVTKGICNNQLSTPCGGESVQFKGKPLGYLKFMITQQRIPISAVSLRINGNWKKLKRSGDNFWQPAFLYTVQDPNKTMAVKISCADGSAPLYQYGIIPAKMLCAYQTPNCLGWSSTLQCR